MGERYEIHILDGYTDGKPSWRKARLGVYGDKEAAAERVAELNRISPDKYRVRKVRR